MATVTSFPPIARSDSVVLILGSMPGRESLLRRQYYAHPRNAFWHMMGELIGAGPEMRYPERKRVLRNRRIAVWDVLQECHRSGSLDSAIESATEVSNDFATFFARYQGITALFFNGRKAEAAFRRHLLPETRGRLEAIQQKTLPSTSPAHASLSWEEKLDQWRVILECLTD